MEMPFRRELRQNIIQSVRQAKADGTVAMSLANLRQCVPTPSHLLPDAPMTQVGYVALFGQIAYSEPIVEQFINLL